MDLSDRTLFLNKTFVRECAITLVQGEGHNLWIDNVLFGGFLPTKSSAVHFISLILN